MPTKRQLLDQLKRDELIAALDRFDFTVDDRRLRDQLIDALASSRKALLVREANARGESLGPDA